MAIFYTSDTHFGHTNILKYCSRPFNSVEEMDKELIKRWNSKVSRTDTVYHLGDFCCSNNPEKYFNSLNGNKILIVGNHDDKKVRKLPWGSCHNYLETNEAVLFHYGMRVWNGSNKGKISLYGHSHGKLVGNTQSLDVGVDCWNYYPVTIEQIKERLKILKRYNSEDTHK